VPILKTILLTSAAGLATLSAAHAADLPAAKAVPIEYVRVCTAYGAGFFYIPGTDTCLRISGRARAEYGYQTSYSRNPGSGTGPGDLAGFITRLRFNVDARTQTGYGTLRAFLRLDAGSRTGIPTMHSGTQNRIGNAFQATGIDAFGRNQNYINTDKAFIQFAGITAGRASSFFDFYAHDFEFIASTMNSNLGSTNLLAYTGKFGDGFTATLSMEDPVFRRTPLYVPGGTQAGATVGPAPVYIGYDAFGAPTRYAFADMIQRSRMPDFVGTLRYDSAWGSAQLSAALHEVNTGGFASAAGGAETAAVAVTPDRPETRYGWAVQGGLKINLPFLAPGDTLYLQGAYGEGAQLYTGYSAYTGSYIGNTSSIQGSAFGQYFNDAVLNPFTGKLELSTSFTAVASLLHYWSPEWRSALFASYGELAFARGSRAAQGSFYDLIGAGPGTPGTRFFALNQVLRDNYRVVVGGSLIWSPVKDLDIGVEGIYTQYGVQSGRVLDLSKAPFQNAAYVNTLANPVRTKTSEDVVQIRARIQRDF
jgi:hypothetical protein